MLNKFLNWIKQKFHKKPKEEASVEKPEVPLYLACNGMYIAVIESIERQIQQIEIDFALGTISKDIYDQHYEDFRSRVKELSANYAKELLYSA